MNLAKCHCSTSEACMHVVFKTHHCYIEYSIEKDICTVVHMGILYCVIVAS